MDCSTPGFPVLHYLPEFAQTHVHWVNDAIQPSHPLSLPSPLALNLSPHQVFTVSWLFTSGGQSIGASASASVLPMNIQDWFPLGLTGLISLLSKGLSRVSPAPQLESINCLVLSFLYGPALTSVQCGTPPKTPQTSFLLVIKSFFKSSLSIWKEITLIFSSHHTQRLTYNGS